MEYKGQLYGKVGRTYFPLQNTTEDFHDLEEKTKQQREVIERLKKALTLAKNYIYSCPLDPNFYYEEIDAYKKWNNFEEEAESLLKDVE